MARRGFFAELQYQNQLAEKRRLQAEREHARAHARAVREAERSQRQAERAAAQFARATAAEQKAAEREAKRLYEESRAAEAEALNAELANVNSQIDTILQATLGVDDFVDLNDLRAVAAHPPFARTDLETPIPVPPAVETPPEPVFAEPAAPSGLGGLFGKKKHAAAVEAAKAEHAQAHARWLEQAADLPARQKRLTQEWEDAEARRQAALRASRADYRAECDRRDAEAAATNRALDALIEGVNRGENEAVEEYVGIVLSNSVYPEDFPVSYEHAFDATLKELDLTVLVPPPSALPTAKEFRYVRSKDEISKSALPKKDLKERYASAVSQVAVRTLHEIFEGDRWGHVNTIALAVATEAVDPATGRAKRTPLIAVAAERESFLTFDLSNVVPAATLEHLGASVSRNPFDLVGIDTSQGVRAR